MRLYLVRHGAAVSEEANPVRPLSPRGKEQAEKIALFLMPLGISVRSISHSENLRAAQTAGVLAGSVTSGEGVRERSGLGPMDPVEPLADELGRETGDLMIVGHLPFLGRLASLLILGNPEREIVTFREAAAVCLEGTPNAGGLTGQEWRIAWTVTPETLP
ncbi:MAG: phosphohistidine phosphatase SixA [Nitrospinota bacterium]|jgi:phosphohistidine phosphatase|nr:phosphohistidine phosphatase SixA [Nitrospinota bacterium]MDP6619374.1 phosphohistidine phosphatase SixA [Nitrospinota bacterium]